jgi:hypothetical protein
MRGGGGRGCGLAASIGLLMEIYMFCVLERFDGDRSLGGGGYVSHFPPSPSLDRWSFARNARKKPLGWTFNVIYAGGRVMGVSMVIAA